VCSRARTPTTIAGPPEPVVPDPGAIPRGAVTRFAPAPTGHLHLGHLVNALYVWGIARAAGGEVVLRIEDHDRQRSRPAFEAGLLEDLERLELVPDRPPIATLREGPSPYRQSDSGAAYRAAVEQLRAEGRVYACDCARSTFDRWEREHGAPFAGTGCPGGCRGRGLRDDPGSGLRVALGGGRERWVDALAGPVEDDVAPLGDLLVRDRLGNWTYGLCVVVDDMRHGVDLVIRGRDLLHATAVQIRLGRALGRDLPPAFLHHPLVRRPDGTKLSKADGATAVRWLLAAGRSPAELFGHAAELVGLGDGRPLEPAMLAGCFERPPPGVRRSRSRSPGASARRDPGRRRR